MTVENSAICMFYKYGFCKFKTNCKNKHVTKVCDDEKCSQSICQKRHPRMCRFFHNYGSCKLGITCAYSHVRKNGNEKLEKKLDDLIDTIKRKDDALTHCEKKIDELIKINIEKDNIIQKLLTDVKELSRTVKMIQNDRQTTKPSPKKVKKVSSKKKENTIEKAPPKKSYTMQTHAEVIDNENEESEEAAEAETVDKNQVFIESCLQSLDKIEMNTQKMRIIPGNDEKMQHEYLNIVTEIEKELKKLDIYKFDLKFLVTQMVKYFPKRPEFQKTPSKAILNYVKSVKEDLNKISKGEELKLTED